ncbi:MAG: FAD-binding oxidoreductase [Acidobacteriaceae bacterium]|nr:FAD-binding oxidoreductase [Acidobacteriaceae bacterium]
MNLISPSSPEDLAQALKDGAASRKSISISGNNSKRLMAGPILPAEINISTQNLRRILHYERDDLTLSVEAGMPFSDLQAALRREGQMIALDPPFAASGTIGGVVAANLSGPMRRGFGTARDLCIGMTFATLEGDLVKTGGMVVKNVAGLDMGKLMIGSFGTLAVLTSINFRVHPLPQKTQTFLFSSQEPGPVFTKRDELLRSVLKPLAIDILTPAVAARFSQRGFVLAVRGEGSRSVLARYSRELSDFETLPHGDEETFWAKIQEFTPEFLKRQPNGVVLRISSPLSEMPQVLRCTSDACLARAGSGISYVYLASAHGIAPIWNAARQKKWTVTVDFAPDEVRGSRDLWLSDLCGTDSNTFAMMRRVKSMFDPVGLLNRSRLYGRI